MKQEKNLKPKNAAVYIASRSQKIVACPRCWTDQRTERDFYYRCGARFVYLDEASGSGPGTRFA